MTWVRAIAALALGQPTAVAEPVSHEDWFPGTSSIAEEEVVPRAYRGRWAPDAAACADQDGVEGLTILMNGVEYYEAGGRLERVTQAGQERSIKLKLAYEGEGGFWDRVEVWTLSEDGNRLMITEESGTREFSLVRC